jgi:ATP-dependent helicase/nuclease subunit A
MSLTAAQQEAVAARGNVLVVAGAGTGKTRTLVERCLDCLISERPRASLEEILVVTFTEAAAAEMRQRIRTRIEEELTREPADHHWQEQLALFETAHIGTIHSFCYELVRAHFYELELDPQLTILPEEEARLIAEETLDQMFHSHYAGKSSTAEAVQQLIQTQARGSDQPIRALILRLHKYSQSLPDSTGWLQRQREVFASPDPVLWRQWLQEALVDWRHRAVSELAGSRAANSIAEECFNIVSGLPAAPSPSQSAAALARVLEALRTCPNGKKKHWVKPLKDFFEESRFLASLMPAEGQPEPVQQDWDWVRSQMATLLGLAGEFATGFTESKRELGVLDFQDLEQYALRLLWDSKTDHPSTIAQEWRRQLRFIFVDEYQDINAAQDTIIRALSREGGAANRFLVGDVKQSIYRFRLANPHIFQSYVENWRNGRGRVIPLQDNFRSHKGILEFVNSVAEHLMHRELGGVEYDQEAGCISVSALHRLSSPRRPVRRSSSKSGSKTLLTTRMVRIRI